MEWITRRVFKNEKYEQRCKKKSRHTFEEAVNNIYNKYNRDTPLFY